MAQKVCRKDMFHVMEYALDPEIAQIRAFFIFEMAHFFVGKSSDGSNSNKHIDQPNIFINQFDLVLSDYQGLNHG